MVSITMFEANPLGLIHHSREPALFHETRSISRSYEATLAAGEADVAKRIIDFGGAMDLSMPCRARFRTIAAGWDMPRFCTGTARSGSRPYRRIMRPSICRFGGGGQPGDCCYYRCARQLDRQCPAGDCQRRWKLFYFQPFCRMSGQSCDVSGGCVKLSCSVCLPLCGISFSSAARISDRMPCHAGRVSAPCRNGCAAERR